MEHPLKNFAGHLFQISADSRTRGPWMAASAEFAANLVHIDAVAFRPHAETNFALRQFLKKNRDHYRFDGTDQINQAVDIVRLDSQSLFCFIRENQARDSISCGELGLWQNFAKQ